MAYELINEKLYDYTAGVYCGVLVPEHVMKKLAKLQAKHLEEVKKVLTEYKEELYPSMWTLYHPNGEQTVVRYVVKEPFNIEENIRNAVVGRHPTYIKTVYSATSRKDAKRQAEERFAETGLVD